jgi:hypothetical protein
MEEGRSVGFGGAEGDARGDGCVDVPRGWTGTGGAELVEVAMSSGWVGGAELLVDRSAPEGKKAWIQELVPTFVVG